MVSLDRSSPRDGEDVGKLLDLLTSKEPTAPAQQPAQPAAGAAQPAAPTPTPTAPRGGKGQPRDSR